MYYTKLEKTIFFVFFPEVYFQECSLVYISATMCCLILFGP